MLFVLIIFDKFVGEKPILKYAESIQHIQKIGRIG